MLAEFPKSGRLPVSIVTGFLGSGKTTLLNQILTSRQTRRIAVIVNEIGEIGIDADLIVSTENDMVELSNGCICCSINNDLAVTIQNVLNLNKNLDHIVVETTGVADPLPVALTFMRAEFRGSVRVDAIVAVIDSVNFAPNQFGSLAARNQLRYGDVILINKSDLVDEARLKQLERIVRDVRPKARIIRTVQCNVSLPLILGSEPVALDSAHVGSVNDNHAHCNHEDGGSDSSRHLHEDQFDTVSFQSDKAFAAAGFQAFLEGLPDNVFRAKGILAVEGSENRYIFHLVGERFTLDVDMRPRPTINKLVFIGRGLDRERILDDLKKCIC